MKYNIIIPASHPAALARAVAGLTREFGGCTVYTGSGFWANPALQVPGQVPIAEFEPVAVAWAVGPDGKESAVKTIAREIKAEAHQDTVLWFTEPAEAHHEDNASNPDGEGLEPGEARADSPWNKSPEGFDVVV